MDEKIDSLSINLKPILYSAILPGSGEYSMGYKNRAYLFLGIEALAISTWYIFNQKGLNARNEYIPHADEHWNLLRWFADYSKWDEHLNFKIWDEDHHIKFIYQGIHYSTNSLIDFKPLYESNEFRDLYNSYSTESDHENLLSLESHGIIIEKDHHYYENIGKYDHFYAGWEDNNSFFIEVKDDGGENISWSPYKKKYRETWNDSNDYYRIASYALASIVANHFSSMVDVLILSKLSNNKVSNLSARTYFSPLNPYGIGGITLSFNWN